MPSWAPFLRFLLVFPPLLYADLDVPRALHALLIPVLGTLGCDLVPDGAGHDGLAAVLATFFAVPRACGLDAPTITLEADGWRYEVERRSNSRAICESAPIAPRQSVERRGSGGVGASDDGVRTVSKDLYAHARDSLYPECADSGEQPQALILSTR